MSNYRPGYDPSDLERTILQEEIRRRSLHQSPFPPLGREGQPTPPILPAGGPTNDYAQHLSMLQRQQQPTGHPGGYGGYGVHSAYGRNPYATVNPSGQLAQMYAVQQERQRQQAAVAAAAAAVGWNGSSPYGSAVVQQPPPGLEHHHHYSSSPFGLTVQPHAPPQPYGRESSYGSVVSSSAGVSPSAHDLALVATHPQQRPTSSPPSSTTHAIFSSANRNNSGSGGKSQSEAKIGVMSTPTLGVSGKQGTQQSGDKFSGDGDESQYGDKGFMNDASQRTNESGVDNVASIAETPVKGRLSSSPQASGSSGKKSFSSTSTVSKDKSTPTSASKARIIIVDGVSIIEDGEDRWFTGCVPLGLDDDKYWLSELQVYLRSHFAEAFGATEDDIAAPMHGRNKPIALGQVGIRCMHCKLDNPAERGQQATSYPSLISGIYNSVQQMLRLHLDCCLSMPSEVRTKIEQLKSSCSSRGGRKQYWIDSAKRLGLVDTHHGIHFDRDPTGPLQPLAGPSVNSKEGRIKKKLPNTPVPDKDGVFSTPSPGDVISTEGATEARPSPDDDGDDQDDDIEMDCELLQNDQHNSPLAKSDNQSPPTPPPQPPADSRPLVFPEDKSLISDYLYLTLEQMAPCFLMEADRVGCYKTRKVGFPGLACKHCVGQAGCGRYFPASEASLSQTTTSQTIMNHARNCRRCPIEIRENLEIMKRNRMGPDGKRFDKPKHGGRKVFFHRLWCRIQDIPFEETVTEIKEGKKRKNRPSVGKKNSTKSGDDDENDSDAQSVDDQVSTKSSDASSDAETESDDATEATEAEVISAKSKSTPRKKAVTISPASSTKSPKKKKNGEWYSGCVRLAKSDDLHWLTELECFARSELIEAFSYKDGDPLDGYAGRRDPCDGQVGIRCVYCKELDPADRINGSVVFPESMSQIHSKVTDMIRLHFPCCPSIPDAECEALQRFKSHRSFDAKVANEDAAQYWVDAARDIGLSNKIPTNAHAVGQWGIIFRRDPLEPSPADELDLEQSASNGSMQEAACAKNSIVRFEDRECTDHVLLLLRQVRPCRFQANDRRAGPGSRGRDRSMGFRGLCCLHCIGKNTLGRYFPISAKNLTDSTANLLHSHISSCSFCPEQIKASLAYLGHRSILQKAELSGSWKKTFFQKVWDRLHSENDWTSADDDMQIEVGVTNSNDNGNSDMDEHTDGIVARHHEDDERRTYDDEADDADGDRDEEGSGSENEDLGENMNALIRAAAIWLTEQDSTEAKAGCRTKKAVAAASFGRSTALPTAKRRRVHF